MAVERPVSGATLGTVPDPLQTFCDPDQSVRMGPTKSLLIALALACTSASAQTSIPEPRSSAVAEEIESGHRLRERYGLPIPTGTLMIEVNSVAIHHLRDEASTIVWLDQGGEWRWDQAVEIGPGGLLKVDPKLESHETRTLTVAEGRRLDRLVRSKMLYSEPTEQTGTVGIGAPLHVMSIQTRYSQRVLRWDGRLRGIGGAVADIVLSHD